jgi:hypothetical protein
MNVLERLRRRLPQGRDDRGVTLAEMAVTTGIMAAVMAIFTTGVIQLFQAGNKNELVSLTTAQLNTAFLRLDRELRYAAGFATPRTVGSDAYVEYVNTGTITGTPECAQLKLDAATNTLRRQVWPNQKGVKPTGKWAVLANNVNVAKSGFTLSDPAKVTTFQQLTVSLVVVTNPGRGQTEALTTLTFTALNSRASTDTTTVCPEARS